jgi:hypothetical protein
MLLASVRSRIEFDEFMDAQRRGFDEGARALLNPAFVDEASGNLAVNGVPVTVTKIGSPP